MFSVHTTIIIDNVYMMSMFKFSLKIRVSYIRPKEYTCCTVHKQQSASQYPSHAHVHSDHKWELRPYTNTTMEAQGLNFVFAEARESIRTALLRPDENAAHADDVARFSCLEFQSWL